MKSIFNKYPVLCVCLLLAVAFTPLMLTRDFSPSNELRYLNIVDEALADGHLFAFTNQNVPYADKPPLFFWLMMLCKLIFGEHSMFALAMLSLIPACGMLLVMDKWIQTACPGMFSPARRAGAALLLATSGLYLGMSVFLRMDMLMCLWIVLALWAFWRLDHGIGREGLLKTMLPIYIFLALFTKGPVGIMAPILAIVVFLIAEGRWRDIFKYLGLKTWGIIALLCAVWFTGVWIDGGKDYLNNLLFHQTVGRAVNSFHHKAPLWYYIGMIWGVLAPWCLATVPATVMALITKGKGDEARKPSEIERFFALTSISVFVMLSCFSSKLAIYLAPLFPFMVYLFPIVAERRGWNRWFGAAFVLPAFLMSIIGVLVAVVAAVCIIFPSVPEIVNYPFIRSAYILGAGLVLFVGGIKAIGQIHRHKGEWQKSLTTMALAMMACIFLTGFKMPEINDYVGYGNLCKLIPEEGEVYTMGVRRPENMDVYLGRDIYDFGKDDASFLMIAPKSGTLVISTSFLGKHADVMEYLEDQEFEFCGPYAVYRLDKSQPKAKTRGTAIKEKRRTRKRDAVSE